MEVIHARRCHQIAAGSGIARGIIRDPEPVRSGLSTSLTLAAMSLGYGVVQLDVTIVNTALGSIGARWAAALRNCNGSSAPIPLRLPPSF